LKLDITILAVLYLVVINVAGYFTMYTDKKRAIRHEYRIPEKNLWLIAIIGGAVGTTLGMNHFRHKTKHLSFKLGFPFLAVIQVAAIVYTAGYLVGL